MKNLLTSILLLGSIIAITGCDSALEKRHEKSKSNIIYESLTITVYKINVDGMDYIVAERTQGGIAIIKHNLNLPIKGKSE